MKRKWMIPLGIVLALVIVLAVLSGVCSARVSPIYGEKNVLSTAQSENTAYLEAWSTVSDLTAACEVSWKGKWPDWFGGFGVVENEGSYLTNVYLTEDTETHRKEVCEAAGQSLRAYTATTVSWKDLKATLAHIDKLKSLPGVNILSMGIQIQDHCVRVYLSHLDFWTTIALGLTKGPLEVVIIPAQPTIRTATRQVDGSITLEMGGLTYSDRVRLELSTDAAFEQDVTTVDRNDNSELIQLPSPGEGKTWYVRARAAKLVGDQTFMSEWSAAKTIRDAS